MSMEAQMDAASGSARLAIGNISEMGRQRLRAMVDVQESLLSQLEEIHRGWFKRLRHEVTLTSDLTDKLAAARTFPDATVAYQEWMSRRMELAADDGRRLLTNGQKIMETGVRLISAASNGAMPGEQ